MNISGKHIAVLGAGRSGLAAQRLATSRGAVATIVDSGDPAKFAMNGVFGESALKYDAPCDFAVVSPGIDLKWPIAAQFVDRGVEILGEIEFAYRFWTADVIGITGTNGKTTTTELTTHLLNQGGQRAVAGGNYGVPFAEIVLSEETWDVVVLELSSFQLETIQDFRPSISVWMNFAPDHMDRYTAIEDYRNAKLAIFQNQQATDWAIVHHEDAAAMILAPQTLTFSAFAEGADLGLDQGKLTFRDKAIATLRDTHLSGKHNAENLMAAMAVGHVRGLDLAGMRDAVSSYKPPRHRCEKVSDIDGVLILNDSKATNVHALESSLRALDGDIILIAGGKQKGLDYNTLKALLPGKVKRLIAIGEIREALIMLANGLCPALAVETLEEAVADAMAHVSSGQTILFSPGTSSFDMFTGYEDRGDVFSSLIKQHLTNHETYS